MDKGNVLTVSSHRLISESVQFEGSRKVSLVVVTEGKGRMGLEGGHTSFRIFFCREDIAAPDTPCCCCGYDACKTFVIGITSAQRVEHSISNLIRT